MDRFKNLVVGIDITGREHLVGRRDLSEFSRAALEKAVWIARRNGATLHVLTTLNVEAHAEELIKRAHDAGQASVLRDAEERLETLTEAARTAGVAVTVEVGFGSPSTALLHDVIDNERDLVVVGTRERSDIARVVMGSTAARLVAKSPTAVWVARRGPDHAVRAVLAPVDFGEVASGALGIAAVFAAEMNASLHVLHVIDNSAEHVLRDGSADEQMIAEYRVARTADAEAKFDAMLADAPLGEADVERHLVSGVPSEEILSHATKVEADLVVMGALARGAVYGTLLGSTATKVLPHLDTSLLVLKPSCFRTPFRGE